MDPLRPDKIRPGYHYRRSPNPREQPQHHLPPHPQAQAQFFPERQPQQTPRYQSQPTIDPYHYPAALQNHLGQSPVRPPAGVSFPANYYHNSGSFVANAQSPAPRQPQIYQASSSTANSGYNFSPLTSSGAQQITPYLQSPQQHQHQNSAPQAPLRSHQNHHRSWRLADPPNLSPTPNRHPESLQYHHASTSTSFRANAAVATTPPSPKKRHISISSSPPQNVGPSKEPTATTPASPTKKTRLLDTSLHPAGPRQRPITDAKGIENHGGKPEAVEFGTDLLQPNRQKQHADPPAQQAPVRLATPSVAPTTPLQSRARLNPLPSQHQRMLHQKPAQQAESQLHEDQASLGSSPPPSAYQHAPPTSPSTPLHRPYGAVPKPLQTPRPDSLTPTTPHNRIAFSSPPELARPTKEINRHVPSGVGLSKSPKRKTRKKSAADSEGWNQMQRNLWPKARVEDADKDVTAARSTSGIPTGLTEPSSGKENKRLAADGLEKALDVNVRSDDKDDLGAGTLEGQDSAKIAATNKGKAKAFEPEATQSPVTSPSVSPKDINPPLSASQAQSPHAPTAAPLARAPRSSTFTSLPLILRNMPLVKALIHFTKGLPDNQTPQFQHNEQTDEMVVSFPSTLLLRYQKLRGNKRVLKVELEGSRDTGNSGPVHNEHVVPVEDLAGGPRRSGYRLVRGKVKFIRPAPVTHTPTWDSSPEESQQCPYCSQPWGRRTEFIHHIATVHTTYRQPWDYDRHYPFSCLFCGQDINSENIWLDHMAHDHPTCPQPQSLVECPARCGGIRMNTFRSIDKHLKSSAHQLAHGRAQTLPYRCILPLCGKLSDTERGRNQHMRISHSSAELAAISRDFIVKGQTEPPGLTLRWEMEDVLSGVVVMCSGYRGLNRVVIRWDGGEREEVAIRRESVGRDLSGWLEGCWERIVGMGEADDGGDGGEGIAQEGGRGNPVQGVEPEVEQKE
ncbi:hypothetical protein BJ508DRAFT_347325 [Ascobolus immersus RN42]|uniref:C2H2-type domain-containing protein n=1 Tax=Ascobolus immersus RN42 TaxID=1160509 RepID=A0A3N4IEX8_ASCIM|nr:hypothetical protein BJ508DRAFT_347325 [Ascobolus immersus RN42]